MPANTHMTAVGILMIEHRLIEKMVCVIRGELERIVKTDAVNTELVDAILDFLHVYVDNAHHGKEEDVFFRELTTKDLSEADEQFIAELINEHKAGRATVGRLAVAKERYLAGESIASKNIAECLSWLVDFYPGHIQKEDKRFFNLYKQHLNRGEQERILVEFMEFNDSDVHERYANLVENLQNNL